MKCKPIKTYKEKTLGAGIDEQLVVTCGEVEIGRVTLYEMLNLPNASMSISPKRQNVKSFNDGVEWIEKEFEKFVDSIEDEDALSYDDAIALANGCLDYNGGHRGVDADTYHHGIRTVINALERTKTSGLKNNTQSMALYRMGKNN